MHLQRPAVAHDARHAHDAPCLGALDAVQQRGGTHKLKDLVKAAQLLCTAEASHVLGGLGIKLCSCGVQLKKAADAAAG